MITLVHVFVDLWDTHLIAPLTAIVFIVLFVVLSVVLMSYGAGAPYLTLYASSSAVPKAAVKLDATDVRPTLQRGSKAADPAWPIF